MSQPDERPIEASFDAVETQKFEGNSPYFFFFPIIELFREKALARTMSAANESRTIRDLTNATLSASDVTLVFRMMPSRESMKVRAE